MFDICYEIPEREIEKLKHAHPAELDEVSLHYDYSEGMISLFCQDPQGEALAFEVPVLDFAVCLFHIVKVLKHDSQEIFEFTESAFQLSFSRNREMINISANFADWSCLCSWKELQNASSRFLESVLDRLCQAVPELAANAVIQAERAALEQ